MTQIDLALVSGRVRTLDDARPTATAIAIADGKIVAVGDDAEIRALVGDGTEVVELGGAAVVPGLIDSHMHPFMGAEQARGADLLGVTSLDEVRRLIAAEAERCAPGEWVLGFGLGYDVFGEAGVRGDVLVEATGGAPGFFLMMDLHTAVATPKALEIAGVDGPREFAEQAEIVCDADGTPTGELREWPAVDIVRDAMPPLDDAGRRKLYVDHLRRLATLGITTTHAMDGSPATHDTLRDLEAGGDLVTRIIAPLWIHPDTPREEWEALAAHRDGHGRRWRGGVAKFFIDGVIDSGTAWLFEPDTGGDGTAPFWPDPQLYRDAVKFFSNAGFQCVTHACGDRAVHEALEAYREAGPRPAGVAQHRIEHVETIQPDDLPRFAAEGVTASMQTQHMMDLAPDRSDNWSRRLGDDRCDRAFRTRELLESGALVTLGSDWPVARCDAREGLASARLRANPHEPGRAPYDDQALTGLQALRGYTVDAARATADEDRRGVLRAGLDADIAVFAHDPADVPAEELLADEVLLTIVDGEVVHRAL
jgi:predicted amidohydrolase YtcJ